MRCSNSSCRLVAALAFTATTIPIPAHAFQILLGSDYFETVPPTFFIVPNGYPNSGQTIQVKGFPTGPGSTDTIVQRQGNCGLSSLSAGSNCTIPIEMVSLSLVASNDPTLAFRESPTTASTGSMTITMGPTFGGGTFDSFFDIYIEVSTDGGVNFSPFDLNPITANIDPLHLISTGTQWGTMPHGLLVNGLIGDQDANWHTNKVDIGFGNGWYGCQYTPNSGEVCTDFFILGGGVVTETDVLATHTARGAVPEPSSLSLLGIGIATALGSIRRRRTVGCDERGKLG